MIKPDWTSEDGSVQLYCGDCLEILPHVKADVVVTDPPYGIKADKKQSNRANKKHGSALAKSKDYGDSNWDISSPNKQFFDVCREISSEQVFFGGNYFTDKLPASSSWIVWDKDNGTNGYADFELAWTSHKKAARKARWRWHGFMQEPGHPKDIRVHPTQKPLGLMKWVIENYTNESDLVCDAYMGSGTTGVACVNTGRRFIGIELNKEYFEIAKGRIQKAIKEKSEQLITA